MAKDNSWVWVAVAVIAIAVFAQGGREGWFKSESTPNQIIVDNGNTALPSQDQPAAWTPQLSLSMSPTTGCKGADYTGTVTSNMPGATCATYINDVMYKQYTLNSNGGYSETQMISVAGTVDFFVTCRYNGVNYDADHKFITVNNCNTCTDSDGGTIVQTWGNCQDSATMTGNADSCYSTSQVREWMCGTGNVCMNAIMTCPAGTQCISGACK